MLLENENEQKLVRQWQAMTDLGYAWRRFQIVLGGRVLGWGMRLLIVPCSNKTIDLFDQVIDSIVRDVDVVDKHANRFGINYRD